MECIRNLFLFSVMTIRRTQNSHGCLRTYVGFFLVGVNFRFELSAAICINRYSLFIYNPINHSYGLTGQLLARIIHYTVPHLSINSFTTSRRSTNPLPCSPPSEPVSRILNSPTLPRTRSLESSSLLPPIYLRLRAGTIMWVGQLVN